MIITKHNASYVKKDFKAVEMSNFCQHIFQKSYPDLLITSLMKNDDEVVCHVTLLHYTVNYKCTRPVLPWQMEHLQHKQRGFSTVLQKPADVSSTHIHKYSLYNYKQVH